VFRIAVVVALVAAAPAWADSPPDVLLRAGTGSIVQLELDDARIVQGRIVGFDDGFIALAESDTNRAIAISRDHVQEMVFVGFPANTAASARRAREPVRRWGIHFGLPGTLVGDVDDGWLHAFVSPNVLLPILTASGESAWFAGSIGAGVSVHLSQRWKVDAFATVMPLRYTSFYTYVASGLGVGFHYTAASGLSVGFAFPVLGFAARLGKSPYGYDAPFRYSDSLAYFYLAGLTTLPLATIGYRF
jgi:hypothetical protein